MAEYAAEESPPRKGVLPANRKRRTVRVVHQASRETLDRVSCELWQAQKDGGE
jgi:hypothetical protein